MEQRGDWFTEAAPNFCDLQPRIANSLEELVLDLTRHKEVGG